MFSGLSIIRKDKPFSTEDSRPSHRAAGWDFYDRGKVDLALSNWASSSGINSAELLNTVIHILNKNNVEFIRAPYSAWAQVKKKKIFFSWLCVTESFPPPFFKQNSLLLCIIILDNL